MKTELEVFRQGSAQHHEETEEILQNFQLEIDKTVLTMMQDALKAQKVSLATNFAMKLRGEDSLSAAIVIANHFGKSSLANLLENILNTRIQAAEEIQQQIQQHIRQDDNGNNEYETNENNFTQSNDYSFSHQQDDYYENVSSNSMGVLSIKLLAQRIFKIITSLKNLILELFHLQLTLTMMLKQFRKCLIHLFYVNPIQLR